MVEAESSRLSQEAMAGLAKRQAHDLRNFLNGMEMELTLLAETVDETERKAAFQRMRQEMRVAEALIRSFAAKFVSEKKSSICVSDSAEQWMSDARSLLPKRTIAWDLKAGQAVIHVDAALLRSVLSDLLLFTAGKYARVPLEAACRVEDGRLVFTISCEHGSADDGHAGSHEELLWSTLQHFASRMDGLLECLVAPPNRSCCRLTFRLPS